ncbi:MAG: ribosome maturation factor RimM [Erysipelotrichaceae bacterium]|nr:ribosome maturation factor RimM [Erysipelotrichaceae bacterium]
MELIRIGHIQNTFGIKGELKVQIITDFPDERFKPGHVLYVQRPEGPLALKVISCRYHQQNALLSFEGYDNINQVEYLKGFDLFIDKSQISPLADGFYSNDLLDLPVYHDNQLIGTVKAVEFYPAHSILRVRGTDSEILIPFIDAFIKKVDLDKKRIDVILIDGML